MAENSDNVDAARNAIGKTILSKFRDQYDIEHPENVPAVVQKTLETLAKQSSDTGYFLNELRRVALEELTAYSGDQAKKAEESAVTTIAELAVYWFSINYNPEKPLKVRELVNKTVAYLQRLQDPGYGDMSRFYAAMLDTALQKYKEYKGEHPTQAYQSVLHVYDEVTRKNAFNSSKRKGKTTRRIKKP
jgi:hypothetical protein